MPAWGPQPHQIGSLTLDRGGGGPTLSARLGTYGPGSYTFVAPVDGDYLFVVQGAGGPGFTANTTVIRCSGGGGPGYSDKIEKLTKGQSVPMVVGAGGMLLNSGGQNTPDAFVAGQTTTVSLPSGTITVTPGGRGTGANASGVSFSGGVGGAATGGTNNFSGGAGGDVNADNGIAFAGSPGGGPGGGAGGAGSSGDANGNAAGGGGGGAGTLLVPGGAGRAASKSAPVLVASPAGGPGMIISAGTAIVSAGSPARVSISWLG